MIGITAIGAAFGQESIDNVGRAESFGRTAEFVSEKVGFTTLRRMPKGMETSQLCVLAYEELCRTREVDPATVECLVVVTQNPDGAGLPHTSVAVQSRLGLGTNVAAFDVSLGCSGYVYGLSVVKAFMEANGMRTGLLFTADPYSKVLDREDVVTELLFGDGATCTLLTDDPVYAVGKTLFGSNGEYGKSLEVDPETGKLSMDGREIFNFTMRTVPKQIQECMELNGTSREQVDVFVVHQASKYIVQNMAKRLKLPPEKMPFALSAVGNTISSTIPMVLQGYMEEKPGTILLSGFGVGLSWATTILKKA